MKWKIDWWALYAEVVNIKNRQSAHIHHILVCFSQKHSTSTQSM